MAMGCTLGRYQGNPGMVKGTMYLWVIHGSLFVRIPLKKNHGDEIDMFLMMIMEKHGFPGDDEHAAMEWNMVCSCNAKSKPAILNLSDRLQYQINYNQQ